MFFIPKCRLLYDVINKITSNPQDYKIDIARNKIITNKGRVLKIIYALDYDKTKTIRIKTYINDDDTISLQGSDCDNYIFIIKTLLDHNLCVSISKKQLHHLLITHGGIKRKNKLIINLPLLLKYDGIIINGQ